MIPDIKFILIGYLSGGILYARIFGRLLKKINIVEKSKDGNPGTANAFMHGGFLCGFLTLVMDILKGFIPVFFYVHTVMMWKESGIYLALAVAAPVIGHIFPIFYQFKGGKGIATTFGCLLGLYPHIYPACILAFFFIFFSVIVRITPHYDRTIWTYLCALVLMIFMRMNIYIIFGFLIITGIVCLRLHFSEEEKDRCRVRLLWMR